MPPSRSRTRRCLKSWNPLRIVTGLSLDSPYPDIQDMGAVKVIRVLFFFCVGVAVPVAYGQEPNFQYDPIEHYTGRFLTTILILGLAITAYSILRYRGRITGIASWMFLAVGIV